MPEEPDDFPQPLPLDDEATQLMTPPTGGGPILPASAPRHEVIGDYEVLGKLGAGGMGAVYRARQISLGRTVALKVLPHQFMEDAESVARFQREARVAASLSHANLVRVYAAGEAEGSHFIAMELIEGEDLGVRLKREKKFPGPEALRICLEVARGLEHAWRTAHLVHRDIKPGNIFLAENGEVKVGDLGLAKSLGGETTGLTQTGTMMGTPHYLSPEQARGDREIDFRSDIYALGCTLYHLLTGQTPYGGTEAISIIRQHLDAPLPAILKVWPQCPIPLARLVGKMLKKHRNERQANYGELIAQMETVWAQIDPQSYHPEAFAPPPPADPEVTLTAASAGATVDDRPTTPPTPSDRSQPSRQSTPAKSRLPLYGGIAALLLVLAVVLVLALQPKEEKLTKAEIYARERAAEEQAKVKANPGGTRSGASPASADPARAGARPPAAERWRDVLRDPAQLVLSGKVERVAGGLRFNAMGAAIVRDDQGPQGDGAIRMRTTFGGLQVVLRAGSQDTPAMYHLKTEDEKVVSLQRNAAGQTAARQEFLLRTPLVAGEDFELELRIANRTLTATLNGEIIGTFADEDHPKGPFGVQVFDREGAPTLIKSLEVLDLAAPAGASATAAPELWQDILRDSAKPELNGDMELTPDGLRVTGGGMARRSRGRSPQHNGAIRLRAIFSGVRLQLFARHNGNGGVYIADTDGQNVSLTIYDHPTSRHTNLQRFPLREPLRDGVAYTLEVRVVEQTFTLKFNDEILGTVTDGAYAKGDFAMRALPGTGSPTTVTSLEVLDLDAAPATGIASSATSTTEPWQDMLRDPADLAISSGAGRVAAGLEVTGPGMTRFPRMPEMRDGALRIRATFGGTRLELRGRRTRSNSTSYQLCAVSDQSIVLARLQQDSSQNTIIGRFKPREPLLPGKDYELELRIVGPTLTAKLNGEILGVVTDATYPDGEFLNLAVPGETRTSLAAEPWQDMLRDPAKVSFSSNLKPTSEGLIFNEALQSARTPNPPRKNGAIRMKTTFNYGTRIALIAREWIIPSQHSYRLFTRGNDLIVLAMTDRDKGVDLKIFRLEQPLQDGQDYELELRVEGQTLTAKFNGKVLGTATDGAFDAGRFGVGVGEAKGEPAVVKSLEYLDLDTRANAEPAEPWQDVLRDPAKLNFDNGTERTPDGLRLPRAGFAMLHPGQGPEHNGAIRIRATYKGALPVLRVRAGYSGGYQMIATNSTSISLGKSAPGGNHLALQAFPLRDPLQQGREYEVELRVVDQTLTAKIDGQAVGTVTDGTFPKGRLGLKGGGETHLVKSVEVLDLDVPGGASTAPAGSEPWQDMLADPAMLQLDRVPRVAEGLRFAGPGFAVRSARLGPKRDGAVRMHTTFGGVPPKILVRRANGPRDGYQVVLKDEKTIVLARRQPQEKVKDLREFPLEKPLQRGEEYSLELRVVGQTLTVKYNDESLGTVTDDTHAEGQFGVGVSEITDTPTIVKSLQILDLDAPAGASAAPGVN